jgi:hypothetical protein
VYVAERINREPDNKERQHEEVLNDRDADSKQLSMKNAGPKVDGNTSQGCNLRFGSFANLCRCFGIGKALRENVERCIDRGSLGLPRYRRR